jgi:hypothetical protein
LSIGNEFERFLGKRSEIFHLLFQYESLTIE